MPIDHTERQKQARGPQAKDFVYDFFLKGTSAGTAALALEGICLVDAADNAPNVFKDKRLIEDFEDLCLRLSVKVEDFETYATKRKKNISLYVFLEYLKSEGFIQAEMLLDMVHDTTYRYWLTALMVATGVTAGLTTFFYLRQDYLKDIIFWFKNSFPQTAHWFKDTYLVLKNIPLLGAIGAGISLVWSVYWIALEPEKRAHDQKRWVMFAYAFAGAALSIAGYIWWYLRNGALPRLTIASFVLGSLLDVIEVIHTYTTVISPEEPHNLSLVKRGAYYRDVYRYNYACDEMYAKLAVAVLCLAMTIILCFVSQNLVLSIGFVLIGWGLNGVRALWLQHRDYLHKNTLQDNILFLSRACRENSSSDNNDKDNDNDNDEPLLNYPPGQMRSTEKNDSEYDKAIEQEFVI